MKLLDLGVIAFGILCAVLAHYFPDVKDYLLFVGGGLTGWGALNRPSIGKVTTLAVAVGLGLCLHGSPARADANDPSTGGCAVKESDGVTCKVSYHLSLAIPVTALDLSKSDLSAGTGTDGVTVGPCYGITWRPGQWYASGVDVCGSLVASTKTPNRGLLAMMVHISDRAAVGLGRMLGGDTSWLLLFAPRLPVF